MKSGIHIYCNKINGKKYIGQSVRIKRRLKDHLKESRKEKPAYLIDKAIRKHKTKNFYIIKIKYPKEKMNEMEVYYIKFFDTMVPNGYNLTSGGDNNYKVSDETMKKMSEAQKGEKSSI